jgi:hypothetical protein
MTNVVRASLCGGGLVMTVVLACASAASRPATQEELSRLTTEALVYHYIRLEWSDRDGEHRAFDVLKNRDMRDVFGAIGQIFDAYDPRTRKGRAGRRGEDAYWAEALLWVIDNNVIRARALEDGRAALAACRRRLDRKEETGHDRVPVPYNDAAYSRNMTYRAEQSQYRGMLQVNATDEQIATQLERDHGIKLSKDDLPQFSDFLTAKDPRYVAWSTVVGDSLRTMRLKNFEPYYQAYLEFRKGERIRQ